MSYINIVNSSNDVIHYAEVILSGALKHNFLSFKEVRRFSFSLGSKGLRLQDFRKGYYFSKYLSLKFAFLQERSPNYNDTSYLPEEIFTIRSQAKEFFDAFDGEGDNIDSETQRIYHFGKKEIVVNKPSLIKVLDDHTHVVLTEEHIVYIISPEWEYIGWDTKANRDVFVM